MSAPSGILSSFVTLLVTIGPIETAVIFASITVGIHRTQRASLARRSTVIAETRRSICCTSQSQLSASPAACCFFLQALSLTFSGPGLSSISEGERRDAEKPGDIAVFPLAFPLIAGPGALSAAVLLMGRSQSWMSGVSVLALIGICLGITYVAMRGADRLVLLLGQTGADVVGRISGILLAGLAVQIIFDGLEHAPFLRPLI